MYPSPRNILLIEDDPNDQLFVKNLLISSQISVISTDNINSARLLLKDSEVTFDCILLDLNLPGPSGLDFLSKPNKAEDDIPIVILSDSDDEETQIKTIQMGAQDYLSKSDLTSQMIIKSISFAMIRSALERELEKQKIQHELASQAKTRFLSLISHEFRTPLNVIIGFSTMLEKTESENLSERGEKSFKRIVKAGSNLKDKIEKILLFTELIDSKRILRPQIFSLKMLEDELKSNLKKNIKRKKTGFEFNIDHSITVNIDHISLFTAISYLIENSLKFTSSKHIFISSEFESNGALAICVSDGGLGICEQDIERAFEAFEVLDNVSNLEQAGVGIGLATVKKLANLNRCEVNLNRNESGGLIAKFILPKSALVK